MADDTTLGSSVDFVIHDVLSYGLTDTIWNATSSSVTGLIQVHLPKWMGQYLCPGTVITAVNFAYTHTLTGLAIMEKFGEETFWYMSSSEPSHNIAELCAGLGGWSQGAEFMGGQVRLFVDINPTVTKTLTRANNLPCMNLQTAILAAKSGTLPAIFVLEACIKEPWVWVIMGLMNIKHVLASTPCPPWSTATEAKGLNCNDGQLLLDLVTSSSLIRIESISLENVSGIAEHCHYQRIRKTIRELGWKIIMAGIHQAEPMCPMHRGRWLIALVPQEVELFDHKVQFANQMKMPCPALGIGRNNSMLAADCVQEHFQSWEMHELTPQQDAIDAMSRYDLLPVKQRTPENRSKSPHDIFMLRVKTMKMCLPTIMAMQGSQHCIPEHLLKQKGLFAFVVPHQQGFRYIAPFEVLCAMAFAPTTMLPRAFSDAFHCCRLHHALGSLSPFHPNGETLSDVMCAINRARYKLQHYQVLTTSDGMYMFLDPIHEIPRGIKRDCNDIEGQHAYETPKNAIVTLQPSYQDQVPLHDVSPTCPFTVEQQDDIVPPTQLDDTSPAEASYEQKGLLELDWNDLVANGAPQDWFLTTQKIDVGGLGVDNEYHMPQPIKDAWENGIIPEHVGTIPFSMHHPHRTWAFIGWVKPHMLIADCRCHINDSSSC